MNEPQNLSAEQLCAALEAERDRRQRENKLAYYQPYERQKLFHSAGATHRERLFLCGNQLGKTLAGGFEAAMHATGRYAPWWQGKRFDRPVVGWVCGVTGETARDTVPAGQGGRAAAQSQRTPLPNS
jgi:hypothetical protein